jgi:hypothetical protein
MKEEEKNLSRKNGKGWVFFLGGLIVALAFGWGAFPRLLYSEKIQPLNFLHSAHADGSCDDCHSFRADGSFTGFPKVETCRQCHEDPQGETEAEKILIEQYIQKNREVPWISSTRQPDNVFFTHASHLEKGMECTSCHRDVAKDKKLPGVKVNRLTGYREGTMGMVACEKCHEQKGAANACASCHK